MLGAAFETPVVNSSKRDNLFAAHDILFASLLCLVGIDTCCKLTPFKLFLWVYILGSV